MMASDRKHVSGAFSRRTFLKSASLTLGGLGLARYGLLEGWAGAAPAAAPAAR